MPYYRLLIEIVTIPSMHLKDSLRKIRVRELIRRQLRSLLLTLRNTYFIASNYISLRIFKYNSVLQKNPHYVITSKDEYAGTFDDDIANPLLVTEIATELIITRLYLLDLLNSKRITPEVIVVCASERKCLYTGIFNRVISYHDFKSLEIPRRRILDLLQPFNFDRLAGGAVEERLIPYLPFYQNWNRDKDLILNVDTSSIENSVLDRPFIALVIRMRGAWPEKNMSEKFWHALIRLLLETELDVVVFGRGAEIFCTHERVVHISSFPEWCHVVRSPNIRHIGSTMTGGVYPALVFGKPNTNLTLIDNLNLMDLHGGDPSFYHESINFSKCPIEFIDHIPSPKEFFDVLTKSL